VCLSELIMAGRFIRRQVGYCINPLLKDRVSQKVPIYGKSGSSNMKNSILVLGVIASAGVGFFQAGSASASAIVPQPKTASSLTVSGSHPDFNYTGTNEDGDQEDVKTGKGRK
jgi:hypothetical protein